MTFLLEPLGVLIGGNRPVAQAYSSRPGQGGSAIIFVSHTFHDNASLFLGSSQKQSNHWDTGHEFCAPGPIFKLVVVLSSCEYCLSYWGAAGDRITAIDSTAPQHHHRKKQRDIMTNRGRHDPVMIFQMR